MTEKMLVASLQLEGFRCRVLDMSGSSDYIEVSNPTSHPHWITIHNQGRQRMKSKDWDMYCRSCSLRHLLTISNIHTTWFMARQNKLHMDIIAKEKDYEQFLSSLNSSGMTFAVLSARRMHGNRRSRGLTVNQLQAVRLALETGFFDTPKRTDIRELSKRFGCSPSTMSETLRRAEKKIFGEYINPVRLSQIQRKGNSTIEDDSVPREIKPVYQNVEAESI